MRAVLYIFVLLALSPCACAQNLKLNTAFRAEQTLASELDSGDISQARLTVLPEWRLRWKRTWSAELDLRIEAAASDTGLGTINTYQNNSKPLEFGPNARLEVDKAVFSWRKKSNRLTLGKQTLAWGVLDGLQVTDRFDAVRRREAVFTPYRPERISRWGTRLEARWAGIRWEAAALFDGTADQFAEPGDSFEIRAPRLRAGLPAGAPLPGIEASLSDHPTMGFRARRQFGPSDASVLVIRGPDTEPVIVVKDDQLTLDYKNRTLFGMNWQLGTGAQVWRVEAAFIPNQSVNLVNSTPVAGEKDRLLAGIGLDWDLPDNLFLNLQIGVDKLGGSGAVRPNSDTIATLRLQKSFANETFKASAEILGNLNDGDGTFRPAMAWLVNDQIRLETGLDIIWGDVDGLFGQFNGTDRLWLRAIWAF